MWTRVCIPVCRNALLLALALSVSGLLTPAIAGDVSSSVDLNIWGRAVFNASYDTALQFVDFMSFIVDDEKEELTFNPRDTRLGFKASVGDGGWAYSGVFEIDFYGSSASNNLLPRLRLGYVEATNGSSILIRGGQDWVPVAQQNPGTIDFGIQSWSGNLWWRVPQLTARYRTGKVELLASAMKHRNSNPQERQEKLPWFLGRIAVSDILGEGSLVALGGGIKSSSDVTLARVIPATTVTGDYTSYLVALELKIPVAKRMVFKAEAFTGQGIGREFVHYGFDYNPWHPDGPREIQTHGGFACVDVTATETIHFNAGYGLDDPEDADLTGSTSAYLKNQTIFVNMKHALTKQVGWGLEVIGFTTTVADGPGTDDLKGQRFTGSWWFVF